RPGFAALMEAVRKKQRDFDVLVIRDVDRFGRDLSWSMVHLQTIIEHGTRVWCFGGDNRGEITMRTFAEKLMLAIRSGGAEEYAAGTSRNTKSTLHQKAREGKCTGTKVYGYDIRRAGMPAGSHGP